VDINQVYRAPSIPKLGKKTVSSSVLRSASVTKTTPKLKTTRFSFIKPRISAEDLKTDVSSISSTESLIETNRILVDIQRQLAIDFAMRIAEEKQLLKDVKKAESRRKFASKEKFVESTQKISGALGGTIFKIASPIKSVFDKIKEFFSLILTGIVLNAAFKWLQNPENRAKLEKVFEFVGTYWKELIGVFLGIKLAGVILKLVGLAKLLRGKGPGGGSPLDCAGVMKCFATSVVPFLAANPKVVNQIGQSFLRSRQFLTGLVGALGLTSILGGSTPTVELPSTLPVTPEPDLTFNTNPQDQPGFNFGYTLETLVSIIGGILGSGKVFRPLGNADGGTIPAPKKCTSCSSPVLRASSGMTVPGQGPGWIDSVRAMLAPGEEVIRATSAMLFRPLLKDINDNAGRKWTDFSQAIKKLFIITEYQQEVQEKMFKVIEQFSDYLKEQINKKLLDEGIGGAASGPGMNFMPTSRPATMQPKIIMSSTSPRSYESLASNNNGSGGMTFLPMVLPTQKSKPPEIPQMQGKATEVPVVSPVDFSNPWMEVSPEWYGIQLYG
jgi:hypothetical protein